MRLTDKHFYIITRVRDNFSTIPAVLISRDVQVMPPACCRRNSMP